MRLFLEEAVGRHVGRVLGGLVLDEVAEAGVVAVAHGALQRDGLLGHLEDLRTRSTGRFISSATSSGVGSRPSSCTSCLLHPHQLVDRLDHVHRDADGAGLVGDGAGDGLADPPGGVGAELVAAAVLELLDRLHQAHVALLDQVEEGEAAVGVFLGDGDHEAQVGLDHLGLGRLMTDR
jgi:hypothetical protein